jgi:hypothetical protein
MQSSTVPRLIPDPREECERRNDHDWIEILGSVGLPFSPPAVAVWMNKSASESESMFRNLNANFTKAALPSIILSLRKLQFGTRWCIPGRAQQEMGSRNENTEQDEDPFIQTASANDERNRWRMLRSLLRSRWFRQLNDTRFPSPPFEHPQCFFEAWERFGVYRRSII